MRKKISAVYKITNTVTGDFYIGSSKDVKQRWSVHKCPSYWKKYQNNPMYLDMKKYGTDKFDFEILEKVEIAHLKEKEQWFIETLKPTYNSNRANGWNTERYKEYLKKYCQSDKRKEYLKSDKYKESQRKASNKYKNQLCYYNGKTIAFYALYLRFYRAGIENPAKEAKKYLLKNSKDK